MIKYSGVLFNIIKRLIRPTSTEGKISCKKAVVKKIANGDGHPGSAISNVKI